MNDRLNTIFGWVLASAGIALGASIISGKVFHAGSPEMPENPGYFIEAPEEDAVVEEGPALATLLAEGSAEAGAGVFARCQSCHSVAAGASSGLGPALHGIVGQPIGSQASDFNYSTALTENGGTWTYEALDAWLANSNAYISGNKMSFAGLSNPQDRANVILYMLENGGGPELPPLPVEEPEAVEGEVTGEPAATES